MNTKTLLTALFVASAIGAMAAPVMAQTPSYAARDEQIHGRITSFDGAYALQVRDDHGNLDNVRLHEGTVINPTGITLAPGMVVSVDGYNAGSYFAANEVDTPYTVYGGLPYYLGHPWYSYGPAVSLNTFFGRPGWWHGSHPVAPVAVNHGGYVHDQPAPYRGGVFHGRNYVAAPQHGGYSAHVARGPAAPRGAAHHG
jgi:hypothetical protein